MITVPLLPVLYLQSKRIRASVPILPEARGNHGVTSNTRDRSIKMLLLGESTIAGVGVETQEEGFAGTLAAELSHRLGIGIEWFVHARSGYTAKIVTQKLLPNIEEKNFDLIVIGLGGNDAFTLNTIRGWRKDIGELIKQLRRQFGNVPIFFANMPPIKEFPAFTSLIKFSLGNLVELFGEALVKLLVRFENVYYSSEVITVDGWVQKLGIKPEQNTFFSDGVHPSKLTYQTWAKDFALFIESKLKHSA